MQKRDDIAKRLQRQGFGIIDDRRLCKKREIILNRGLNSPDSNFYVFIRTTIFGRTKVFFTDPSRGEGGEKLSKRQLMRRFSTGPFGSSEKWKRKVEETVIRTSAIKAPSARFVNMHGHWGENATGYYEKRRFKDDGVSSRRNIIREQMLWHMDIDATGYHNNIIPEHLMEIIDMEAAAGMLKVPSIELTLPRANPDHSNGPHLNIYFRDLDTAIAFYKLTEERLVRVFPGMAPVMERSALLKKIDEMRTQDQLALGVAHPYGETKLGERMLRMGLINEIDAGESIEFILNFVRDHADAIAIFNPTFSNNPVSFPSRMISEAFFSGIVAAYLGSNAKTTQSNITYAFAMWCKHNLGKRPYFDPDTHVHAGVSFYWRMVSPLAYGRTVIHFTDWEKARARLEEKELDASEFVRILRRASFPREDETVQAKLSYDIFVEMDNGKLLPVPNRRSHLRTFVTIPAKIIQGLQYLKMARQEARRRLKGMPE